MADCCSTDKCRKEWYQNKTVLAVLAVTAMIGVSYAFAFLGPFRHNLFMYFGKVWWAVGLGLVIGGAIDHYVPQEHISHVLAKKTRRTILYSTAFGFFMSACCHGILAISIQLYKKGASVPAVVAFLLASPWANLTFTVMLIGFFGLTKGLFIVFASLVIAIVSGLIFQALDHFNLIEKNPNTVETDTEYSIAADIRERWERRKASPGNYRGDMHGIYRGTVALANMVVWWVLVGTVLAAAIASYVPAHIFRDYLGPHPLGLLVTLAFATVVEVCSEGSAPIAFEIFRQTGALGNALVFLLAGVATDYTEIGLLWANIGRKTALWLPAITIPQIVAWGMLANAIFKG